MDGFNVDLISTRVDVQRGANDPSESRSDHRFIFTDIGGQE